MLDKITASLNKWAEKFGRNCEYILDIVFQLYGWRGFLLRLALVFLMYQYCTWSMRAGYSTFKGGKLLFWVGGMSIFTIGKLVYDYTKLGKASQEKKNAKKK